MIDSTPSRRLRQNVPQVGGAGKPAGHADDGDGVPQESPPESSAASAATRGGCRIDW